MKYENRLISISRPLGREAGRDVLVVRGYDPTTFKESVYEATAFYDPKWKDKTDFPAILVTDTSPSLALSDSQALNNAKVMLFPLEGIYREHGTITGFLEELLQAVKSADALSALEKIERSTLEKGWGWLRRYVEMKPGFFGFNVDLNKAIDDLVSR